MARPTKRCIYCGNPAQSSEHIIARCLLEKPYPNNLLTVPACSSCNHSVSSDEKYFEIILAQIWIFIKRFGELLLFHFRHKEGKKNKLKILEHQTFFDPVLTWLN